MGKYLNLITIYVFVLTNTVWCSWRIPWQCRPFSRHTSSVVSISNFHCHIIVHLYWLF